jgi:hypothetical protein
MNKQEELRDNAWVAFWKQRPYALRDERFRVAFFAGYDACRAEVAQDLISIAAPYEGLLMDHESRKWIAPKVWTAIEQAVEKLRHRLLN